MYKILGSDQKEYGPVSAEQIRQWIAQGRANANTLAQAEGSVEWKTLSSFAEFAPLFAPKPPFVSSARVDTEALAGEILACDYILDIGRCIGRAWDLLKSDFWPIVGVTALIMLIIGISGAAYVSIVVSGPLMGGLFRYYLKRIRGERATLEDSFSGFSIAFLQLFLGYLVSSLLTALGLMACILPGIYLAVAWQFTLLLIVDKRIEFWPAMELGRKVVSKHWWNFFGLMIVAALINLLGLLACVVGAFVTMPLTFIALAYAYEDVFQTSAKPAAPAL